MKKTFFASSVIGIVAMLFSLNTNVFASGELPISTTGDMVISAGLTPASPFYFLDRLSEMISSLFTFNPEAKVKLQIKFSKERIAEIKVMVSEKDVEDEDLEEAESIFLNNITDAKEILHKEKSEGKDIKDLAKTLNDEFDDGDKYLEETFKETRKELEEQSKEIKELLKDATETGDIAELQSQLTGINEKINALVEQKDKLKQEIKTEKDDIDDDENDEEDEIEINEDRGDSEREDVREQRESSDSEERDD